MPLKPRNNGETTMTAKEQFAWVWLTALTVVYTAYFGAVAYMQAHGGIPYLTEFVLFTIAAIAQVIILGVGYLIMRFRRDARQRTKPDERDRAIERRAAKIAYYVLMAGTIYVGCYLPFVATGWTVARDAVAVIVIAEFVHQVLVVRAYRSGWQG